MFYKSQIEVGEVINKLIDAYWNNQIKETIMINDLNKVIQNNYSKIMRDEKYTRIIEQRCGKRRLEVVSKVMNLSNR